MDYCDEKENNFRKLFIFFFDVIFFETVIDPIVFTQVSHLLVFFQVFL
jgi:hypothetical protein